MPNPSLPRQTGKRQSPEERIKNFNEVAQGLDKEHALEEASRCLNCKNPRCQAACPVNVQIPSFIQLLLKDDVKGAVSKIMETSLLPAVCGRVCPQEKQCESKCVRGIKGEPVAIGRLERFVADYHMAHGEDKITVPQKNGKRIAVVGSGPSGLTCAGDLAKLGYEVTVYEAFHTAGSVLMYGIPEFRLPK
uniref:NAD(P)-binding protein n=1 Tax=Candidatus Proelusimicrobium excrementi TaxID=3416222 RepID=UPI003D11E0B6